MSGKSIAELTRSIRDNHRAVERAVVRGHGRALRSVLEAASVDLRTRLTPWRKDKGRFTPVAHRAAIAQVEDAIVLLKHRMGDYLATITSEMIERGIRDTVATLRLAEEAYIGSTAPLAIEQALRFQEAVSGVKATMLRQRATSMDRYGRRLVSQMEQILSVATINRLSVGQVVDALVGMQGPSRDVSLAATVDANGRVRRLLVADIEEGLFVRERFWAERIARTEMLYGYNASAQATMEVEIDEDFPDLKRIIIATFDRVTGDDSIFVHGEVRGVRETFLDGAGRVYLFPPARPNDREIVLPWREAWGDRPAELRPRPSAERRAAERAAGGDDA